MASAATRADHQTAAAELSAAPARRSAARHSVAVSGGSATTGREPAGQWVVAKHAAKDARPAAMFAKVSMSVRAPELAKWIAARPSFTFAEAAAASAPSPCSPSVMAYTLPGALLASALAELGYLATAGGKNGYTVTAIDAFAQSDDQMTADQVPRK
jgi:hypothetical protein